MLYRRDGNSLKRLSEDGFPLEKELQRFVEENLWQLLHLKFIATEFTINEHNRADTVAFDEESNAFVIIEDKNVRNTSLVDQGFGYLAAMLDRKEKFVLEYNTVMNKTCSVKDFDWSQSRVIFVSPEFTQRQIDATSFRDMAFELYELRKYGDTYSWNDVTVKIKESTPSSAIIKDESTNAVSVSEIDVLDETDFIPENHPTFNIYTDLKSRISELPDVQVKVLKSGIKFKLGTQRFAEVDASGVAKTKFDLCINKGNQIKDPTGIMKDITGRRWGNLTHLVRVDDNTDLDAMMYLIKQAYDLVRNED